MFPIEFNPLAMSIELEYAIKMLEETKKDPCDKRYIEKLKKITTRLNKMSVENMTLRNTWEVSEKFKAAFENGFKKDSSA